MGAFASIVRGALAGANEAGGNPEVAQALLQRNQQAQEAKQAQLRMQIMPHAVALKGLQTKLQSLDPNDPTYHDMKAAITHDIARNLAEIQQMMNPDPNTKGNFFERGITDKLHLTSLKNRQDKNKQRDTQREAWAESGAESIAQGTPSYTEDPKFLESQALEKQRAADQQALEAEKLKNATPKPSKGFKAMEQGGVAFGIENQDTGEQYLRSQLGPDGNAPTAAKEMYATILKAQADKQAEVARKEQEQQDKFNRSQANIESRFERSQADKGTWTVAEDGQGNPILFNSKTGEQKESPGGMHKSGYFAKQIAPLEAASMNIKTYIDNGVFDGPGDLSLQHEFFTATQPSTGFRMTKVQQDILQNSQSWLNSFEAKAYHALTGTWFSGEQRKQIAKAAQDAIDAKEKVLQSSSAGPRANSLGDTRSKQKSDGAVENWVRDPNTGKLVKQ